jgi:urease accessory protein
MLTLTDFAAADAAPDGEIALPYESREKSRLRAHLADGTEAALFLPRGTVLRGGDLLKGLDGGGAARVIRIAAAPEPVLLVECHDTTEFARCAYHLGNRHTPVQIIGRGADGHFTLRIRADHVLADMLAGLGAHSTAVQAPFEPESGAYGGHSHVGSHDHDDTHGHGHDHDDAHAHAPHPGNRMPVHQPKIHRPDLSAWKGTQDK